jgi:peptidoglycan/LPS O-acetylase OafA/YrhL
VWAGLVITWLMPLLFLVSGASTFFALRKGPARFVKDRTLRLLVPLVVGIFSHLILCVYLERRTQFGFRGSFFDFLPHYFDGLYLFGGNFAWMGLHLWYLEVLFLFSLLCLPLFQWLLAGSGRRLLARLGAFLALPGAVYLLALPGTLLMPLLDPARVFFNRAWGGWGLPTYLFFFIGGLVIYSHQGVQDRIRRQRWLSLGAGFSLLLVLAVLTGGSGEERFGTPVYALVTMLHSLSSWCWVLGILGLGMQYLTIYRPFLGYAGEAVLPFYILHQSVILAVGYFVVHWNIPDLAKFGVILIVSLAVTLAIYEFLVRRWNVMRVLFGLRPLPKKAAGEPAEPQLIGC